MTPTTRLLVALGASLLAAPAMGASLAFDFDRDDDPTTIENETGAELGELLIARIVLNDVPSGHAYVHGFQFGLNLTGGLELVAMAPIGLRGGMANDGTEGILITLDEPLPSAEFPSFAMELVLRVRGIGSQVVGIVPSTGWDVAYEGFVLLVSETGAENSVETIVDPVMIETQVPARIDVAATPVESVSWGRLKAHF